MTERRELREYLRVPPSEPAAARAWSAIAPQLYGRPRRRWPLLLALAVPAVALALFVMARGPLRPGGGSGPRVIELADGSRVTLEGESRLELASTTPASVAVVLRGAAAFDVSRRPGRRFSVRAGDVEVVVVGTRFRVADVGGRIDVAVNEGTVEVWQGDRPQARLGAGARWSGARRLAPAAPVQATPVEAPPPPPRPRPAPAGRPAASAAPAAGAAAGAAAALFEQAARARREGRADAAAAAFDEIRRRHRRDRLAGVAAFQLGRIHLDGGAWRDALDAFRDALRLAPDAPYRAEVEAAVVQALDRSGDRAACARARDAYLAAHGEGPYARSVTRLCRR